jgi:hypothetical protein
MRSMRASQEFSLNYQEVAWLNTDMFSIVAFRQWSQANWKPGLQ